MDTIKLEKQIKSIPLFCCIGILALRGLIRDKSSDSMVIWVSIFASIAVLSFLGRIYLEKKNDTFVLKKYYMLFLVIAIMAVMFIYNYLTISA